MAPLSVRLTPELKARLEEAARRIGIGKHTLAQLAIEAGVVSIEEHDGKIVLPIEFEVTHVPVPKSRGSASYPSHHPSQPGEGEDKAAKPPPKKRRAA